MKYLDNLSKNLDCLLIFVPKMRNFYKPIGEHMFCVLLPMGLMSIADLIQKKGYRVQILHLGLEKIKNHRFSLKEYLAATNPKVVGFSLHWHYQCYDTIEAVKEVKAFNHNIFTVLGGLTASYFHKEIIQEIQSVDAVIRGDGEIPFLELLENIFKGKKIFSEVSNLTWRDQETIKINEIDYVARDEDLDKLDFTNFELLKNYQLYIKMQDMRGGRWLKGIKANIFSKFASPAYFPLLIHKGCLVNCSYCGGSKISQRVACGRDNINVRSPKAVIESIKEAKGYGFKEIYMSYLPFNNHFTYFKELFEMIKKEKIKMDYFLDCWALPTKEIIQMFADIRFSSSKLYLGLSPETGNERIRKSNKGFYYSNSDLIETLNFIAALDLSVILYFSIGLPFETIKDAEDTIRFQNVLKKRFGNMISISTINPVMEPASPMYIEPDKYGIAKTRNSFMDFIRATKNTNKNGFITPELGYFKRDFCRSKWPNSFSNEDTFRKEIQKLICKNSCRLSDFFLSNILKSNLASGGELGFLCSKLACSIIYFSWKWQEPFRKLKFWAK